MRGPSSRRRRLYGLFDESGHRYFLYAAWPLEKASRLFQTHLLVGIYYYDATKGEEKQIRYRLKPVASEWRAR